MTLVRLGPGPLKEKLNVWNPGIYLYLYLRRVMLTPMRSVTLRQLRVFATAARHMNFSRAAQELQLSQPAVSTQIKDFGASVGLPLFERIGRRTYLTPAGAEMLACATAIAQRLKEAEDTLAQLKGV